jgi:hypothetical protein
MISYIEFLKNLSMLHETFDIFFGFDCLDDDSVKSEDVIDENKKSPFFFVNYFLDAYEFITKVNRFIFYIFFSSEEEVKENVDDIIKTQTVDYYNKYDSKFLLLEKAPLTEDKIDLLSSNIVMDCTPNGNVIMFFDYDND